MAKKSNNPRIGEEIFIQSETTGDFNVKTYSKKKALSKKNYPVEHLYFVPEKDGWQSDHNRGLTFFTAKEGILFGAKYEMTKFGKFIKKFA